MESETLAHLRGIMARGENSTVHTGVYNIHRRIQLLYGSSYGVEIIASPGGGTRVEMVLPVSREEEDEDNAASDHRRG